MLTWVFPTDRGSDCLRHHHHFLNIPTFLFIEASVQSNGREGPPRRGETFYEISKLFPFNWRQIANSSFSFRIYMSHPVDGSRKVFRTVGLILIFGHLPGSVWSTYINCIIEYIRIFFGEYSAIIVSIGQTCLMWCFQQLLRRASLSHRNIVTKGFWHQVSS